MNMQSTPDVSQDVLDVLRRGTVIPAHPLALDADRRLDERRQRALSRYYLASGAGGLAVGVHTTQFQIHDPQVGLLSPVWTLAAEEMDRADQSRTEPIIRVAGICGDTGQAMKEATLARDLGYHFGLLSLSALKNKPLKVLLDHCRAVADVIGIFGFYLQQSAGGLLLPFSFWRDFCKIENVRAIKMAPFNRYRTIDVVRAVVESGREDIALYTGNDDNIIADLLTPYRFMVDGHPVERRIVGGLLGQWAVGTSKAVELSNRCHEIVATEKPLIPAEMLRSNIELTDYNAALFDVANDFAGCVPGIHEVLRRGGLLEGVWCLDEKETLSPGQTEELDRVETAYPHLFDTSFITEHRDAWLKS